MNENIKKSLKDIYPDKWKELFLFSVFRLLYNTPIKNMQTYYTTSFLSETLSGAYLSRKKVGNMLREIGEERERIKAFLKQFISRNDFALIDLTHVFSVSENRTYMRDDYQMEGWTFLNFIALVFYYRLYKILADNSHSSRP